MPAANALAVRPLGVAALSMRQQLGDGHLQKSQSVPSLHKARSGSIAAGSKGILGGASSPARASRTKPRPDALASTLGEFSPMSPKALSMSGPFSPGGTRCNFGQTQIMGHGVWGAGPPRSGIYERRLPRGVFEKAHVFEPNESPATSFRRFYERGDLPISVRHGATPGVEWRVEPQRLDYVYHLPIFFDGLLEKVEPYCLLAYHGLQDMLSAARGLEPSLIAPVVPSLITPIKRALNTKDQVVISKVIKMLQLMLRYDGSVGELLVPYYRQILPAFNLFKEHNLNLGDGIEHSQRKRENMGDLIMETLELLEQKGGEDAFINIKYMIPTYESCMAA